MKKLIRIPKDVELPLIGLIQAGLIDRGTNLIQIRPISGCNLSCIFCSVDEGPKSKTRITSYKIDPDYLMEWVKEIAAFKSNHNLEMHIDGCGEPTLHPQLTEIVQNLSGIEGVKVISMQTNGVLLTEEKVDELVESGLSRINLSLNALDPELAKKLSGCSWYDVRHITEIAEYIAESPVELVLSPVWIPSVNDEEIPRIIEFGKKIDRNEKWPFFGVQKYEVHKYGRKVKGLKPITWWEFYRQLEEWEKIFNVKLKIGPRDFGIHRRKRLNYAFKKSEKVYVKVKAPGWMNNEMIGVAKDRCVTIVDCDVEVGDRIKIQILRNKDNIYVARCVT